MGADLNTEIKILFQVQSDALKKALSASTKETQVLQSKLSKLTKDFKELEKTAKKFTTTTVSGAKDAASSVVIAEGKKQAAIKKTTSALSDQVKKFSKGFKGGGILKGGAAGMAGGLIGGITSAVTSIVSGAVGLATKAIGSVVGFATSGFANAFQAHLQQGQALGGLIGLGSRAQFAKGRQVGGARLGYSISETAQQAGAIGRATGNIGAVYKAQQFNRATGMGMGEIAGYMGTIRQAGFGFGGNIMGEGDRVGGRMTGKLRDNSGAKELEKVVAAGMLSGIEKSRLSEFVGGVMSSVQQLNVGRAGTADIGKISSFQSMLSQSKNAGFQGERGARVAAQLFQSAIRPGGGEAGQAIALQSLGFGKPGGTTSYYDALKRQQKGGPENVMAMFKEVYKQKGIEGGGGTIKQQQEANLVLHKMTGLSLDQIEKLGEILNSSKSSDEQMKEVKKRMQTAEPIDKQALAEMKKGFGGTVTYLAGIANMTAMIGGKIAPVMMLAQSLQLKVLSKLADMVPIIIDTLKDLYLTARMTLERGMTGTLGKLLFGAKTFKEAKEIALKDKEVVKDLYEDSKTLKSSLTYHKWMAEFASKDVENLTQRVKENQPESINMDPSMYVVGSSERLSAEYKGRPEVLKQAKAALIEAKKQQAIHAQVAVATQRQIDLGWGTGNKEDPLAVKLKGLEKVVGDALNGLKTTLDPQKEYLKEITKNTAKEKRKSKPFKPPGEGLEPTGIP